MTLRKRSEAGVPTAAVDRHALGGAPAAEDEGQRPTLDLTEPNPPGAASYKQDNWVGAAGASQMFAEAGGDEGQTVEATWGEELFQPEQYNTFRVGPFKAATIVRKGESVAQALVRLHAEVTKAAEAIRAQKTAAYLHALRGVQGGGR